jgi:hypothetical protein
MDGFEDEYFNQSSSQYQRGPTQILPVWKEGDGWSAPRPGRFIPEKDSVPIV